VKNKNLLAVSLGNIVEWFDFGLFIFLAPVIGAEFFPVSDPSTATIAAFSVFITGFLCRPLGGILFGHRGDTQGRSGTLRLSILLISFSTALTGFLPTYNQIGILAPILFTVLRILQGLSVGGEYSGIMIYLTESAPENRRGFMTSFAPASGNLGFLIASLTTLMINSSLSTAALQTWGWRLPFISMSFFSAIIFYYRLKISETPTYLNMQRCKKIKKNPLFDAIKLAPKSLIRIFALTCMHSSFYYAFFGYMPVYLEKYMDILPNIGFKLQSIFLLVTLFTIPMAGSLGDKIGRKRILLITATIAISTVYLCFYLLSTKILTLIIACLCIAVLICSLDLGNTLTIMIENCPAEVRYSGIAFSYNLGMALFGGTTPLVITLLTERFGLLAPAYYLMIMASISLIAISSIEANQKNILHDQMLFADEARIQI
jgi:MHS family proline/betaine transporter-like MFS transporter